MNDIAIRVENLSKLYHIGSAQGRHDTLRDSLVARVQWAGKRIASIIHLPSPEPDGGRRTADDTIWALQDVSFEVQPGDVLGIIGRNGAGKSTLLKILSRITEPTEGKATIRGRVGSLLEVGTGFHPELSGRENIYLNGAILGMRRAEIERKFDEIVAFAEIEKFLDTPVKRYSSGMYVRLAFAVAAHLEPEILLVDEVLAVGDVDFQKKCLGKMDDVAKEGRTVLFVSHNMAAVRALCTRAILLEGGRVQLDDSADLAISRYLNERASGHYVAPASKAGSTHIVRIWFSSTDGVAKEKFRVGEPLVVNVEIDNPRNDSLEVELSFWNNAGYMLWNFVHAYQNLPPITNNAKPRVRITFFVPNIRVREVFVHVGLRVKGYHDAHYLENIKEGLRYLIEEPSGDTYVPKDTLLHCPVEFRVLTDEG